MKKCQTCIYFPCYKWQCSIDDKVGCGTYESEVTKIIKENKNERNSRCN